VSCEDVRQLLPDHVLGTLSETESAAVRRHLRGCSACRSDAVDLDEGVILFARAAHAADPPQGLEERVMAVLEDEWDEADAEREAKGPSPSLRRARRSAPMAWQAVAALVIVLAGMATWAVIAQGNATRFREDAQSYRAFLGALGGKDVRVGQMMAPGSLALEGSAVLYDSDRGQSWALVLVRAPGLSGTANVRLEGSGRTIQFPFPMRFDVDGEGATWLVTAADLSRFDRVVLMDPRGGVIAQAIVHAGETES
jgi:Putative zinc-finger